MSKRKEGRSSRVLIEVRPKKREEGTTSGSSVHCARHGRADVMLKRLGQVRVLRMWRDQAKPRVHGLKMGPRPLDADAGEERPWRAP